MAKFSGGKGKMGLALPAWLLAFAGFAILLGGISAMQQACGGAAVNGPIPPGLGAVGYLAPVPCDRFFSFDWFILFWHFFVWLLVAIFLFSRKVHVARSMLTSLLAIAATLLMFQANTWYRINGTGSGLNGNFTARARTTFGGAIIAAIADLFLLLVLGLHDEDEYEENVKTEEYPAATTTTTTTTTAATTAPETTTAV